MKCAKCRCRAVEFPRKPWNVKSECVTLTLLRCRCRRSFVVRSFVRSFVRSSFVRRRAVVVVPSISLTVDLHRRCRWRWWRWWRR